jgi:uncharacterized protein YecE (DUF72 family)
MLASYAEVFNAVEGNTSFYRVPDARSVASWREAVAGRDFEFSFKLPQTVTHRRTPAMDELQALLRVLEPLEAHLGPLLLQLPDSVDAQGLSLLAPVFRALPRSWRYVIEVRHPEFFAQPEKLEPLLEELGAGRVSMDTSAIYGGDREHPEVRSALHEKPDVPVLEQDYHRMTFARLVLHPDGNNEAQLGRWARRAAAALAADHDVRVMIHCPNNLHCPVFARQFHRELVTLLGAAAGELAPWPVPEQGSLL